MATLPEVTDIQVVPQSPGIARTAVTTAALIAPEGDGATVDPHVVRPLYARPGQVEADHGEDSDLFLGARAAFRSGARRLFAASFETPAFEGQVVEDSDSSVTDEGVIPGSGPIYEVTTVTVDGVAMDKIIYTVADPSGLDPEEDEAYINTITRAIKVGTSTDGNSAGIAVTGKDVKLDPLRDQLLMRRFEIISIAGHPLTEQYAGLHNEVAEWALDNRKTVVYAATPAAEPGDLEELSDVVNFRNVARFVAPGATADVGAGFAGLLSRRPPHGTLKEQPAPRGVDFTDTYTFADFGGHDTPAEGTFHEQGWNAVYQDFGGTYRVSANLSAEAQGFYTRISVWRSEVFLHAVIDDAVRAARRASPTSIPYTDVGIAALESAIRGALLGLVEDEILDSVAEVSLPTVAETDQTDRENGILPDVTVAVRFAGQIEFVRVTVNLTL